MPDPTMIDVESSNLRAIGYDPDAKLLVVEFKPSAKDPQQTRPRYRYTGVEPETHAALMAAESKGAYLHAHILRNPAYAQERAG